MKKVLIVFAIASASYACGGSTTESTQPVSNNDANTNSQIGGASAEAKTSDTAKGAAAPADTAAKTTAAAGGKDGKALIEGSDCRTCHHDKDKLIGPAYADVAKKYKNDDKNVKMLAAKVIAGGKGVWGEIPMTAHPTLSQDDVEAMVKYILTIK